MGGHFERLNHVGIVVRDIDASVRWYVDHLGFEHDFNYGFPGVRAAFVRHGPIRIEFFQTEGATPPSGDRATPETNLKLGGINHFAIEVDNLEDAIADLETAGVAIVSPPREVPNSGGERYAFIHDNEGMLIELVQAKG